MDNILKIHDYHGNNYLVSLEEDINDILWMIEYCDHGDTFLMVFTKDGKIFEYGWWDDRYHFGNYIRDHRLFAKKVSWSCNPFVNRYGLSLTRDIEYIIEHYTKQFNETYKLSSDFYQENFDEIITNLKKAFDTGYMYDWTRYRDDVKSFLEFNKIDTDANIDILNTAPWTSMQIDGCIGIAAKEDRTNCAAILCDSLLSIWDEGSWHDTRYDDNDCWEPEPHFYRNIPYGMTDPDDWGTCSYVFSIQNIKNCLNQKALF